MVCTGSEWDQRLSLHVTKQERCTADVLLFVCKPGQPQKQFDRNERNEPRICYLGDHVTDTETGTPILFRWVRSSNTSRCAPFLAAYSVRYISDRGLEFRVIGRWQRERNAGWGFLENSVLRRIFGSNVTAEWRKLHNEELIVLYSSPNIVRVIKREEWGGRGM